MPSIRTLVFLLLAVCAPALPTWAETLDVFVDAANPPFMYATTGQRAAGIYPALISEAFSRAGVIARVHAVPWKRALSELDAGRGAVGGIYKNTLRLQKYDYSDEVYVERLQAVVLKGTADSFGGIPSLAGKRVGVLRGWSYGDVFDQARAAGMFKVEEVDSDAQNLFKLKADRIDIMIANREGAEVTIAVSDSPDLFVILEPPLLANPTYIAFPKHLNRLETIAAFNKGLASMKADGSWDKIVMSILTEK